MFLNWYDFGARFYDPALGRFFTQDAYAEKYLDLSSYQYGANNPIRFIDVNCDSIDIYTNSGGYLMTIDDGKEEVTGMYFQNTSTDKDGNVSYSDGVGFGYYDADADCSLIMTGEMGITVVDPSDMETAMENSDVNNPGENKWTYIEREGRKYGTQSKWSGESKGLMDYYGSKNGVKHDYLHIVRSQYGETVGYNDLDYGNSLIGMGANRLGIPLLAMRLGAQWNHMKYGKSDNLHTPGYEHKLLDASQDQRAIRNGYYFNQRTQRGGITIPLISF